MLTAAEQQELRQIEQELRDTDRGFAWRLTLLPGVLRWAAPGRRVYLQILAALVEALLRLAAAARRLLMEIAQAAALTEPTALMALGDTSWVDWGLRQVPGHSPSSAQDRPQSDGSNRR